MSGRLLPSCLLAALATFCGLAFAASHLLGWRPCVGVLSGTPVGACGELGLPLGLAYAAAWFLAVLAAPSLLIASVLVLVWELVPAPAARALWDKVKAWVRAAWSLTRWLRWLVAAAGALALIVVIALVAGLLFVASLMEMAVPMTESPAPGEEQRIWCAEKGEALIHAAEAYQAARGAPPKTLAEMVPRFIAALPPGGKLPGGCGRVSYKAQAGPPTPYFTLSIEYFRLRMLYDSSPGHPCSDSTQPQDKRGWCSVKTWR